MTALLLSFSCHKHINSNHLDHVAEQISRTPLALPTTKLNPDVKNLFGFAYEDFELRNYEAHPHISTPIAV